MILWHIICLLILVSSQLKPYVILIHLVNINLLTTYFREDNCKSQKIKSVHKIASVYLFIQFINRD